MSAVALALALSFSGVASGEMHENERQLYELGMQWKGRAQQAEERISLLELKLKLTEESRQRWRKQFIEKPPVEIEVIPIWVPIVTGGSLGAAIGAGSSLASGAEPALAAQSIAISAAIGACVGWLVWIISS